MTDPRSQLIGNCPRCLRYKIIDRGVSSMIDIKVILRKTLSWTIVSGVVGEFHDFRRFRKQLG